LESLLQATLKWGSTAYVWFNLSSIRMDTNRIAELLQPFLVRPGNKQPLRLADQQLSSISTYVDLLLRWSARINLTAVRGEQNIVTRHFGESLFAARIAMSHNPTHLADVGSGAGFPGLPIKIFAPHLHVTLIESTYKKATFLREVIRALRLTEVDVFAKRAEDFPLASADMVTLRAVERFESVLPVAAALVAPGGRVLLLIGRDQIPRATIPHFTWDQPVQVPCSTNRVVLLGTRNQEPTQ
jgi:16S rRNA (guanine527-N7)-methyltransferase